MKKTFTNVGNVAHHKSLLTSIHCCKVPPKIHTSPLSKYSALQARKGKGQACILPHLHHTRAHASNIGGYLFSGDPMANHFVPKLMSARVSSQQPRPSGCGGSVSAGGGDYQNFDLPLSNKGELRSIWLRKATGPAMYSMVVFFLFFQWVGGHLLS